jgi:hypothetical protein
MEYVVTQKRKTEMERFQSKNASPPEIKKNNF